MYSAVRRPPRVPGARPRAGPTRGIAGGRRSLPAVICDFDWAATVAGNSSARGGGAPDSWARGIVLVSLGDGPVRRATSRPTSPTRAPPFTRARDRARTTHPKPMRTFPPSLSAPLSPVSPSALSAGTARAQQGARPARTASGRRRPLSRAHRCSRRRQRAGRTDRGRRPRGGERAAVAGVVCLLGGAGRAWAARRPAHSSRRRGFLLGALLIGDDAGTS